MPRPPRVHVPNGIWHVTQRATDTEVLFRVPADFRAFVYLMEVTSAWAQWILHDYCLMTNHVHLLIQTPEPTLPAGMQRLLGPYVEEFNERHGRRGALVQGGTRRDSSKPRSTMKVRAVLRTNPVGAGLCDRPEEWPWSGYARRAGTSVTDVMGPGPDTAGADGYPPVLATT